MTGVNRASERDFVDAALAFLDTHATRRVVEQVEWGVGTDSIRGRGERSSDELQQILVSAKRWKALEFDAGFGWITGPPEFGGRGLSAGHERAYRDLRAEYDVPDLSPFIISLGMVAPTIVAHGTVETRDRYVRRLYRGELIGCQLFSEPGAGSDLASVSTRAIRDGDDWIVEGQKVWTSHPIVRQRFAEVYCMARTIELNGLRADERRKAGTPPGPLESIFKIANTNTLTKISALASHVIGTHLAADTGEWGTYSWSHFVASTPGTRIAAGTDEIMKNILGERVLGLPKEPGS